MEIDRQRERERERERDRRRERMREARKKMFCCKMLFLYSLIFYSVCILVKGRKDGRKYVKKIKGEKGKRKLLRPPPFKSVEKLSFVPNKTKQNKRYETKITEKKITIL